MVGIIAEAVGAGGFVSLGVQLPCGNDQFRTLIKHLPRNGPRPSLLCLCIQTLCASKNGNKRVKCHQQQDDHQPQIGVYLLKILQADCNFCHNVPSQVKPLGLSPQRFKEVFGCDKSEEESHQDHKCLPIKYPHFIAQCSVLLVSNARNQRPCEAFSYRSEHGARRNLHL